MHTARPVFIQVSRARESGHHRQLARRGLLLQAADGVSFRKRFPPVYFAESWAWVTRRVMARDGMGAPEWGGGRLAHNDIPRHQPKSPGARRANLPFQRRARQLHVARSICGALSGGGFGVSLERRWGARRLMGVWAAGPGRYSVSG